MKRRDFTKGLLATVTSYALIESLFATNAIANKINPLTKHWVILLNEYCSDLKKQAISPLEWQKLIESLYKTIDLKELLKFIDLKKLQKGFQYPDLGVNTKPVFFPKLEGLPENTLFVKKIFGMQKDRAIIPHGHNNMASAHLVLEGEMHLRHYEKIAIADKNLIIKPSIDKIVRTGHFSSISDEKDNVHWFVANTQTAFTFDIIMLDLNNKSTDIQNIDIYEKQNLNNGTIRVPILDVNTALKKYGKHHH
ncbi:MAG: hypothetical protein R2785_10380 [Flavobacteriaceae bacterium]